MTRDRREIPDRQTTTEARRRRTRKKRLKRFATPVIAAFLLLPNTACYQYRAIARTPISPTDIGGSDGPATEEKGELVISYLWGLVAENPTIDNCKGQNLYEVTVKTNIGFTLIKVSTLGIVAPVVVKWRCAKPKSSEGVIPTADTSQASGIP